MINNLEKYYFKNDQLLAALPEHVQSAIKECMVKKKMRPGRSFYKEGTFPKGVYFILRGKVKIFQTNKNGKEQIMYIYSTGEIMGYRPLICNSRHPVSAVALEECSYNYIPAAEFLRLNDEHPELSRELLRSLSHEFGVWVNRISMFAQQPVKERTALALLILQRKYAENKKNDVNLSREYFANYLGTVKETLVRVLQEFKKQGIVTTQGRRIQVVDQKALMRISGL